MAISLKTHKMLWGRSASRCSYPSCRRELVEDATETDDESVVGDMAHIVAEEERGPRGDSPLTEEQRNKYNNLILLCKIHHKLVDDQPTHYSVDALLSMKSDHEQWVRSSLNLDSEDLRKGEVLADIIQEWAVRANLDNWKAWTSYVLADEQPRLRKEDDDRIESLREWLVTRIWPDGYKNDIKLAMENFRFVLRDFHEEFRKHAVLHGPVWWTEKFYKIREWDEEKYYKLHKRYLFHVGFVQDLLLELTRAGNFACDQIRSNFSNGFRRKQGILIVMSGPYMDLSYRTHRPQYSQTERTERPYSGIKDFQEVRKTRDYSFWDEDTDAD